MRRRLAALTPGQQLVLAVSAAAVVGALGVLVPRLGNVAMLLASAAMVAALAALAQWLLQHQHTTDWSNAFTDASPVRGADARISRLADDLGAAARGEPRALATVHRLLTALAHERLRDRRGLDPLSDPGSAQAALGPDLAAYLTGPPTRDVPLDRLAGFVSTLEDL